ncbi:MAG: AAA family ATPase [Umezawaea sp.]
MLVERAAELSAVATALRGHRTGGGSLVVVTGPLGVGRTALLDSLVVLGARREDLRVLRAGGAPAEREFRFGVLRQLFESVVDSASPEARRCWFAGAAADAVPVLSSGSAAAGQPADGVVDQRLLRALHVFTAHLAEQRPLLLLVDDLQCADAASLRWLGHLAHRLDGLPVTVVVAVRDGDPAADQAGVREVVGSAALRLPLSPLSVAGVRAVAHAEFGEPVDALFADACHSATGGLPLLVAGVVGGLARSGGRPAAAGTVPPGAAVRDRLITRLRSLPALVQEFTRAVAVLGDQASHDLVGALAGVDGVGCAEVSRALVRLGLLDGTACRFRHPAVLEAVEHAMSVEERERIHLAAAELLHARGRPAEQVAAQLLATTAQGGEWAADVLRSAADAALRRNAPDAAARYLRRALVDQPPDSAGRAALLVDLATAERGFDREASVRHVLQAVPLFDSAWGRATALTRIAPTVLETLAPEVGELFWQVAAELGAADTLTGARRDLALRLEARVRHVHRADEAGHASAADRLRGLDPDLESAGGAQRELVAALLHTAMVGEEMPASDVARLGNRILECEPATPDHVHTALPLLIPALAAADSLTAVASWLDTVLDRAESDTVVARALVLAEHSRVVLGLGDLRVARAHALRARDLAVAGCPDGAPVTLTALMAVALESMDVELCTRLLDQLGLPLSTTPGCAHQQAAALMLKGFVLATGGDLRGALAHVLECGHHLDSAGWRNSALHPWRIVAAGLHHGLGDLDSAWALADEEYAHASAWGAPAHLGAAMRLRASLTGGAKAVELLREAVTVLAASDNRLQRAKTLVHLGGTMREEGYDEAEEWLRQGRALAVRCGATWLVEAVGAEAAAGSPVRRSSDAPSAPSGLALLTTAERQVARLAVAGHTNPEIADHLSVTSRTVEKHLTNTYRKLAIPGRSGLAHALRAEQ